MECVRNTQIQSAEEDFSFFLLKMFVDICLWTSLSEGSLVAVVDRTSARYIESPRSPAPYAREVADRPAHLRGFCASALSRNPST